MSLRFDHLHIISENPAESARWYEQMLGAKITSEYQLRGAPQIHLAIGGTQILLRGKRPGEEPIATRPMLEYADYSSHNEWGTDHFGFLYEGDLRAFCEELRAKGATFAVEPWEFKSGTVLCYLAAPDGVSIELVQAKG